MSAGRSVSLRRAVARPGESPTAADAEAAAERVMQVLPRVMDAMRQAMRAQLDGPDGAATVPLTVPQFRGLNFVDHQPGASVGALAGFLGVSMATASAMVDRLLRAGYLQAQPSAADRRRVELRLCEAGKAVLEAMRRRTQGDLARALAGRQPPELAALIASLGVLEAAFAEVESR